MKKILSMILAVSMLFSLALTSYAEELISITLEGEDYETGCFVPGKTYYLEAMDGRYHLDNDFFQTFKTKIEVVEGKKFITAAKFQKMSDGYYRLSFKVNPGYPYLDDEFVEMHITATDKKDSSNTYTTVVGFSVGYGGDVYCSDEEFTIYPERPVVEFDETLRGKTVEIKLDEDGSFRFKLGNVRAMNFAYSTDTNGVVSDNNPQAAYLYFMDFYAHPQTSSDATFRLRSPEAKYLYKVEANNSLTQISAPRNNDDFVISTSRLDSYVASDVPLKASGAISGGGNTIEPSESNPPIVDNNNNNNNNSNTGTTQKPNPSTGTNA